MSDVILKVENLSKQYRLGTISSRTISHDLNRWWAGVRGKEDPYLKIGETNDRSSKGESEYVWALKDINFEVKKGEVLGIIGKNGAGKSTLLKILSKVTSPSTGSIKTKGRIASLLEVGTGFHPEMTGKENIYLNGAILGMTKKEIAQKFDEIVEFSGCERYIDTPVKRYSSGMKVRLAFAVAAFLEPDILVVDEVLAVGDAEFQKKAIGKMQDISQGEGRTVLFVSHDMGAVQNLCSRVIVLKDGGFYLEGITREVIKKYLFDYNQQELNRNISNFKPRRGNQKIKFVTVDIGYIEQNNFQVSNLGITSASSMFIDVELLSEFIDKKEIYLSFSVTSENFIPVTNVSNEFNGYSITVSKRNSKFRFQIENMPLRPGIYYLSFWMKEKDGDVLDDLDRAFSFRIFKSDFFGTGKLPAREQHGFLLLENKVYEI